jgi:hypothetical protein
VLRRLAAGYFGGAVGAVVASLALWVAAQAGLLAELGVDLNPPLSWAWLSPRILWGGLWGLAIPLVLRRGLSPVRAGLLLSLAPSLAQLFYFFPQRGANLLGVSHGPLTPLVVLAANAIWGWTLARVVLAVGGSASAPSEK